MPDTQWRQVGLKVEESQYGGWEEYLEESNYSTMSNLIRTAVEREIQRDSDVGDIDATKSSGSGVNDDHVAELVDTVSAMDSRIEQLEGTLDDAVRSMNVGSSVSEETTTEVWKAIPKGAASATTAEGIAAGTDVDPNTARVALDQLAENTTVQRLEFEDLGEIDDGVATVTWQGQEIPIEGAREAVKRRNPLFFREV